MAQQAVTQARKESEKGERPQYQHVFREWGGCFTRNARTACPHDKWYYLENLQPIGSANARTVPNISASLHDFGGDSIYAAGYANVVNVDYLIMFSSNGKVFSYKISDGTTTQIASGLTGSGASMDQWKNAAVVIVDGSNYYSWDGTTFTTRGGTTGAPSSGQAIAVYAGRVWIAQNRLLYYSAADSLSDFQTADGGGNVSITDSQLRTSVQRLIAANGYLYILGRTSINVIADVYVPSGASPPTPVFTNLNVQAIIGTDQPWSVFPYNRSLMLANRYGAFALDGVTAQKISDDIDTTWQWLDFSQSISGGQFVVNNILTSAFLVKSGNDPVLGPATRLALWWDKKWWFGNFGSLTYVMSAYASNVPTLFGMIGNKLYQLFSDTNSAPTSKFITALWDLGDPISDKKVLKAGIETQVFGNYGSASFNVDGPNSSVPMNLTQFSLNLTFQGADGGTLQFTGTGGAPIYFYENGYGLIAGDAPSMFTKYVGMSGVFYGWNMELSMVAMDIQLTKRW
jgi:hypothetical protein